MNKLLLSLCLLAPVAACVKPEPEPLATQPAATQDEVAAAASQANDAAAVQAMEELSAQAQAPIERSAPKAPRLEPQVASDLQAGPHHFEDPEAVPDARLADYHIEMDITIDGEDIGTMVFSLWPEKAPITVRNFLRYADEGFYDGKIFHRIMRDFMIQGGSSTNTAAGQGPHGNIKGEFSNDKKYDHEYGVLSMARGGSPDSGSSQFFIITERSPSARGLDGKYASFGRLTSGVAVLEAIANIEVERNPASGEPRLPKQRATVKEMRVVEGQVQPTEAIERPKPDLHGEPERIRIQHVLISFAGSQNGGATRSKEEAEILAQEILNRAQAGEDFDALVKEYSDDPGSKESTPAGSYSLLNKGIRDREAEDKAFAIQQKAQDLQQELLAQVDAKTITMDQAREQFQAQVDIWRKDLPKVQWFPRTQMVPAFGDVGFKLQVGEVGIANYDPTTSPFGWHIIKRYE